MKQWVSGFHAKPIVYPKTSQIINFQSYFNNLQRISLFFITFAYLIKSK